MFIKYIYICIYVRTRLYSEQKRLSCKMYNITNEDITNLFEHVLKNDEHEKYFLKGLTMKAKVTLSELWTISGEKTSIIGVNLNVMDLRILR